MSSKFDACKTFVRYLQLKFHPGELTLLQDTMSVSCLQLSPGRLRALDHVMHVWLKKVMQCLHVLLGGPKYGSTLTASLLCCHCRQKSVPAQNNWGGFEGFANCRPRDARAYDMLAHFKLTLGSGFKAEMCHLIDTLLGRDFLCVETYACMQ